MDMICEAGEYSQEQSVEAECQDSQSQYGHRKWQYLW